ncbi:uncharacterized protein MELLADRAFT_117394 [Melampsora larici-populina 98AG31]|uniref:Sodium/hydrogen exchanger n=1 Tax=Melampsora larici-populina (strain 98AG31 / pathotype 3-4-7) TaxID=747676 RepID=F4RWP1_MELLP|nr:uncharacterized protein MELLADRAFT_117394 [Melampsora larici-populina 98AG31]EGG03064.1 hypothetical protein MELLADRAFT_117394 [Melampsora larici-populina 98AG31]
MSTSTPDTPPEIHLDPEVEELWSSRALLLVLVLLILSFWVSYYLKIRRIKTIHETLVALFAGMVIGLIVRLSPGEVVQNMISFKTTIMLNVLLPPIILASGYDLKEENFFRNFGVILTFAFCGTLISAVVIGALVYVWALLGLEGLSLGIIECLLFGSTLSATDPVTVLAIFNTLKVDPKLYSVIFGESLLNDAVAIVMFETLSHFHGEKISVFSFFHGVGIFLLVFLTSMALGVVFGLSCSLMLKHSRVSHFPEIESCLVLLIAYTSYFFSNALTMSGIVSLLFCGITLKHYAYHNMSRRTQRTTKYMFTTLSSLCENFIFIYLGLSLFTQTQLVYKPIFIIVSALAVCVARYCAVFPISKVINVFFRRARGHRTDELPHSYQMMLFWAGLRGAVGVALAAGIKGDSAVALRTTVLVTVVLTMVVFGGTTSRMIEIVGIQTGIEDELDTSDEEAGATHGGFVSLGRNDHNSTLYHGSRNGKQSLGDTLDLAADVRNDLPAVGHNVGAGSDDPYDHFGHRHSSNTSVRREGRSPSPVHSITSQDSDDEVLPTAGSNPDRGSGPEADEAGNHDAEAGNRKVWRDGQWFTVLDEQYLLPVFSNATASRKQASRKALRNQRITMPGGNGDNSGLSDRRESDGDLAGSTFGSQPTSPWLSSSPSLEEGVHRPHQSGGAHHYHSHQRVRTSDRSASIPSPFQGSFSDVLSALVNYPPAGPSSMVNSMKRHSSSSILPIINPGLRKKRDSDDIGIVESSGLSPSQQMLARHRAPSPSSRTTEELVEIEHERGMVESNRKTTSSSSRSGSSVILEDVQSSRGTGQRWGGGSNSNSNSSHQVSSPEDPKRMNHVKHRSGDRTGVGVKKLVKE